MNTFTQSDIKAFQPTMKIGLLATINPEGKPHLTLISSIQASSASQLVWGQFTEGLSKIYIQNNPKVGFLVMNMDKEIWRGKADFSHTARDGADYEAYNNTPMFRYNAYFGVHTVYYMDLFTHTGKSDLPMNKVISAALKSIIIKPFTRRQSNPDVLNTWTQGLMNKIDNLKFLTYIAQDGYPNIIPVIHAQCSDPEHIIFSTGAYRSELENIPAGTEIAIFGMNLDMEDVLMRGTYEGIKSIIGMRYGSVHIDWVYNAMPPVPGQIYPPIPLKPVVDFDS
jgi:hypothetical protein